MKKIALLLAFLACACGDPRLGVLDPWDYKYPCFPSGGGFAPGVWSKKKLDCSVVESGAALLKGMMVAGGVETEASFAHDFSGETIYVDDVPCLWTDNGGCYSGNTLFDYSVLAESMHMWMHESFHHLQILRLDPGTAVHAGWEENGYWTLGDVYVEYVLGENRQIRGQMPPDMEEGLKSAGYDKFNLR